MKTKRRHELKTNELADSLSRWIEVLKPYSRAGVALLVAIVVVIFAWGYLSAQASRKRSEGWNAIFDAIAQRAPDTEELSNIATRYAGTQVGQWARVTLADLQLANGTNQIFVDKAAARSELRDVVGEYRAVLLEAKEPMLRQRATFGIARAHEALGTPKDLEAAREEYGSIADKWPDSPYAKDATERAEALDQAPTKEFYDWLARYEPPRPFSGQPGTPGARPDFLQDPAAGAGTELPSAIDDSAPLPKFGDEPGSGPALGNEAPREEPPAEEAPTAPSEASTDAPPVPASDDGPSEEAPPKPSDASSEDAPPDPGAKDDTEPQ